MSRSAPYWIPWAWPVGCGNCRAGWIPRSWLAVPGSPPDRHRCWPVHVSCCATPTWLSWTSHPRASMRPRIGWCIRRWVGCSQAVPASLWRTGWPLLPTPTTFLSWRTGRCASTDHGLPLLPTPLHALPSCCGSKLRRSPYEAAPDLALPGENGALQALALPAPCSIVGRVQPVVPPGGADRPRLLRYAHRAGTPARGHDGTDCAAGGARRKPCGRVAHRWLCRNYLALHDERAGAPQLAAARTEPARRPCA